MSDDKPSAPRRPSVFPGDHIYFEHASGPMSGRVLAHGKHGCTVEADGKRHKVKWENVLGHKKRAPQHVTLIEHGEDGMVVEDASGHRRFIGVVPGDAPERVIVTSKPARKKSHAKN